MSDDKESLNWTELFPAAGWKTFSLQVFPLYKLFELVILLTTFWRNYSLWKILWWTRAGKRSDVLTAPPAGDRCTLQRLIYYFSHWSVSKTTESEIDVHQKSNSSNCYIRMKRWEERTLNNQDLNVWRLRVLLGHKERVQSQEKSRQTSWFCSWLLSLFQSLLVLLQPGSFSLDL